MKKVSLLILLSVLFGGCNAQEDGKEYTVIVTDAMILEEKQRCPAPYKIERIKEDIDALDTLSLEQIKSNLKDKYNYLRKNKKELIEAYNNEKTHIENEFKELTKSYVTEDEEYIKSENFYKKIINNNHLQYKDSLKNNKYFIQIFKDSTSSFKMAVRNNGATIFKFSNEETISPYFGANPDTDVETTITNIYYHDSKEENVPIAFESYLFPLNPIKVPQRKHIDSIEVNFKLKYLTSIDTVRFTKQDIGVEKMGVTLLKMEDNFVLYKAPHDYYEYYKGKILQEAFFNNDNEPLSEEYGLSNATLESAEERYNENFEFDKYVYFSTKDIDTREDLYKTLTYFSLKYTNAYLQEKTLNRQVLKGNVSSLKLYLENTRDSLSFKVMFRNSEPLQNMYVHTLNEKTEFIDKDGNVLEVIPSEIDFLYNSQTQTYSKNYFSVTDEDRTERFYFLDKANITFNELPYKELYYISPSLLLARHKSDNSLYLTSTTKNEKLLEEKITNFQLLRYLEKAIILYIDDTSYYIFDQNKELITPDTNTPVTKIYLKKEYDY